MRRRQGLAEGVLRTCCPGNKSLDHLDMRLFDRFRRADRLGPALAQLAGGLAAIMHAVDGLTLAVGGVRAELAKPVETAELTGRVAALMLQVEEMHRARALWEANTEASLVRALEDHKAARRAEERMRDARRKSRRDEDEEGTLDVVVPETPGSDGSAARLQVVPAPVAERHRGRGAAARQAKWGGG